MAKLLCMDLGTYSVKTLLMEVSFNRYQMLGFRESVLPEELRASNDSIKTRSFAMKEHVESNYSKNEINDSKMVSMVSGDKTVVKFLNFPFRDKIKIRNTLPFELENYVPFDLDEWLVENCIQLLGNKEAYVVSVLANKKDIRDAISEFSDVDYEPSKLSSDSIVLSNLDDLNLYNEDSYALINIGHIKTNITVVERGIITLVRSVPIGGYNLTMQIARACNLQFVEAENRKHRMARAFSEEEMQRVGKNDKNYYSAILDFSFDLVRLLKQSLYSLKIQDKGMVSKIYLSGGTAKIRDLDRFISDQLKIPVSDCLLGELDGNKIGIDFDKNLIPPLFALGLSEMIKSSASGINFRKGEFAPLKHNEGKKRVIKKIISSVSLTLSILVCLFFVMCGIRSSNENKQYKTIPKELRKEFPNIYKRIVGKGSIDSRAISKLGLVLKEEKRKIEGNIQLLEEVEKSGVSFLEVLRTMSISVSNDIKFDIYKLEFGNNKVVLEANASSLQKISEIVKSLEKNSMFQNVKESETKAAATGGGHDFKLRFEIQ